jgi:hypothetical protein
MDYIRVPKAYDKLKRAEKEFRPVYRSTMKDLCAHCRGRFPITPHNPQYPPKRQGVLKIQKFCCNIE